MATTITDPQEFLKMSGDQLDQIFRESPAGDIPQGEGKGTAIIAPGTEVSDDIACFINVFTWKGKVFDPVKGELRNQASSRSVTKRSWPKFTRTRAGSTRKSASCSITRRPRSWRNGSAMRSARSRPEFISVWFTGEEEAHPLRAPVSGFVLREGAAMAGVPDEQPRRRRLG